MSTSDHGSQIAPAAPAAGRSAHPTDPRPTTRNPQFRSWVLRIAGTLAFLALLVWLDIQGTLPLDKVFQTLRSANLLLVALSIALYVPFLIVKAARWRAISADMAMPVRWVEAWRIYAIGLAAGTFTPGQAGDALKAWYLQRLGYPLGRALGGSVLDRLFDVAGLAVLGLVGVAVYGQRFAGQIPALLGLTVLCAGGVAFFAWNPTREWAVKLVSRRLARFEGQDRAPGAAGENGVQATWSLRPYTVGTSGLFTVASFATSVFRVWLLAAALGIGLGPLEVLGFVGLTTAAALVPVTVGGVGTRDAVAVLAFAQLGLHSTDAIALSTLILLLNLAQAVAGWLVWLGYRAKGAGE